MPCEGPTEAAYCGDAGLVECLLDELNGVDRSSIIRTPWKHPAANAVASLRQENSRTALLCERLRKLDVTRYSLELQLWWRDHKKWDSARVQRQLKEAANAGERDKVLDGLSQYERDLVGAVYVCGPGNPGYWEVHAVPPLGGVTHE